MRAAPPKPRGPHTETPLPRAQYSFFGEGWNQWEANQFVHFTDGGLFVGQFGTPNFPTGSNDRKYHLPGAAGNSFSPNLVRDAKTGKTLFLHNDENVHGGVHVWALAGVDFEEAALDCAVELGPFTGSLLRGATPATAQAAGA